MFTDPDKIRARGGDPAAGAFVNFYFDAAEIEPREPNQIVGPDGNPILKQWPNMVELLDGKGQCDIRAMFSIICDAIKTQMLNDITMVGNLYNQNLQLQTQLALGGTTVPMVIDKNRCD